MGILVESDETLAAAVAVDMPHKTQKPSTDWQPFQEASTHALKMVQEGQAELNEAMAELQTAASEVDRLDALADSQSAELIQLKEIMLEKHAAMHEKSHVLSKVPARSIDPACTLATETFMAKMAECQTILNTFATNALQQGSHMDPELQKAANLVKESMESVEPLHSQPTLSSPSNPQTGGPKVSTEDCPSMEDDEDGGKVFRGAGTVSGEERAKVRCQVCDRYCSNQMGRHSRQCRNRFFWWA